MSYSERKWKAHTAKHRTTRTKEETHDVADVAAGAGGVALLAGGAPVVGAALVTGTAVDVAHRHHEGKRKKAQPWK